MADEQRDTTTAWAATAPRPPSLTPLTADARADVCIVGAGIAGLATAYELMRAGLDVIVLAKDPVGAGETGRTSAHLSSVMDDDFTRLVSQLGADAARQATESHGAAIDWIERVAREEAIECEFRRLDGFLFPGPETDADWMKKELEAARQSGHSAAEMLDSPPGTDLPGPCLRYPRQAAFHPLRFLYGLAEALLRKGMRIHTGSRVVDVDSGSAANGAVVVRTAEGQSIQARNAVLATNSPAGRLLETMRMVPYTTFVTALRIPAEAVPDALYWDTDDPYHYVRLIRDADGVLLLVGGGDYQAGTQDRGGMVHEELAAWARARFPAAGAVAYHWSGQVLEPSDYLAFIGYAIGSRKVLIVTGDSGQGLTHGAIAGMRLGDLVLGREERWPVYDPGRLSPRALKEYVRDGVSIGRRYLDHLRPGEVASQDEIARGTGAVVRRGLHEVATYRDAEGRVHELSAVCPHAGCTVHWNSGAATWDCPCHGSRFEATGQLRNGPATSDLGPAG